MLVLKLNKEQTREKMYQAEYVILVIRTLYNRTLVLVPC